MDYDAALEIFFQPSPPGATLPEAVTRGRPARRLRDAYEPIAMHWLWSRRVYERLAQFGLNFITGYVWGRASGMGDPTPGVVVAAFAVWEPGFLTTMYEEGRGKVDRAELVDARDETTTQSLKAVLGDVDVSDVVSVLRRGIDAADATGRPLFAGLASQSWPPHPVGQLWRACDLLREHRGDSHVAACVAAGLGPVAMNILTELYVGYPLFEYSGTRAWPEEVLRSTADQLRADGLMAGDGISAEGLRFREEIEERTDVAQRSVIDAIGDDLEATIDQLDGWSAACIEAKAFPSNIYKRAAG